MSKFFHACYAVLTASAAIWGPAVVHLAALHPAISATAGAIAGWVLTFTNPPASSPAAAAARK
jgi:hypothetical protein